MYVIVRNPGSSPAMFTDHQGVMRTLQPRGHRNDQIKLLLNDEKDIPKIAEKYNLIRTKTSLAVGLSSDLQKLLMANRPSRTTIKSTADVKGAVAKRADDFRKDQEKERRDGRITASRLKRLRAEKTLKITNAPTGRRSEDIMDTTADEEETLVALSTKPTLPKAPAAPGAGETKAAVATAPDSKEGIKSILTLLENNQPITFADLEKLSRPELTELGQKLLKLDVAPETSKQDLINLVLAELQEG